MTKRAGRPLWHILPGLALACLVLAWGLRPRRRPAAILPSPAPARTRRAVLFVALLLPSLTTPAMSELLRPDWAPALERGRQAYARQDYETALLEFEQARVQAPDDPRLALAVGETLFRLDRHEDAALEFERARYLSRTPDLRAESLYNAGTTALAQDDPGTAVDLLRESLRLEPERSDVLHNLEAALLRLQEQQEQQEQQQDQSEQDQDQSEQDQQQGEQDQQQDEQDQQQGEQDQQQDPGEQSDPQDQPPSDPSLPEEMDLEQALQLLQALDRDEQDLKRSIQQRLRGDGARSGREW